MKILLDESVPVQLRFALVGHDVASAMFMGWKGLENGELLAAAEKAQFDVMIVADKNMRYQQNLAGRRMALVELWTNHRPTLEAQGARIAAKVEQVKPGDYLVIGESD